MTYCTLSDVYPLVPTIGVLHDAQAAPTVIAATVPTATQGTALVAAAEAEVLGAIAAAGYTLPVTDVTALAYVKAVITYGAAAFILKAKYPTDKGTGGDAGASTFWGQRYAEGLANLKAHAFTEAAEPTATVAHGFRDSAGTPLATSLLVTRTNRETMF